MNENAQYEVALSFAGEQREYVALLHESYCRYGFGLLFIC